MFTVVLIAAAAEPTGQQAVVECAASVGGKWIRNGTLETDFVWIIDRSAACTVPSREELLARLRGAHVAFVGDSTMRLTFHETLLWGWGCTPSGEGGDAHVAEYYAMHPTNLGQHKLRNFSSLEHMCRYESSSGRHITAPHDGIVLPASYKPSAADVRLSFRWATHAWLLRDAVVSLAESSDPPDVFVINTGFWHLRHPPPSQPFGGRLFGFDEGLANLTATLSAAGLTGRIVWRGCNYIETGDADHIGPFETTDFSNANIRHCNEAALTAFTPLGVPFYDYARYTHEGKAGVNKTVFTDGGGYHMSQLAMRAALPGLMQTIAQVRRASAAAPPPSYEAGSATGVGSATSAAPPGSAMPEAEPSAAATRSGNPTPSTSESITAVSTASCSAAASGSVSASTAPSPSPASTSTCTPAPSSPLPSETATHSPVATTSPRPSPSAAASATASSSATPPASASRRPAAVAGDALLLGVNAERQPGFAITFGVAIATAVAAWLALRGAPGPRPTAGAADTDSPLA